jgi:hypothetical protein
MSDGSKRITTGFQYPARVRRVTTGLWIVLLCFNLTEYLLEWTRALYALLLPFLDLPFIAFLFPSQKILSSLLTAHLGLLVTLIVVRALAYLAPQITLWKNGLFVETLLGRRFIPFDSVHAVHSIEFKSSGRFVVWIDSAKGLPLQNWLASLIFGKWFRSGILITSDIAGFDKIIAAVAGPLKWKHGDQGFAERFIETEPTPLLKMLTAPRATLAEAISADAPRPTHRALIWQMISIAASFALPLGVAAFIHLQFPVGALIVPLAALLEFPLAALYLSAAPMDSPRRMEFDDAWRVYPLTQMPRWLIAFGLTFFVIAGMPLFIFLLAIAPAIALGCYWVIQLTRDWFEIPFSTAWLGALLTAIYQALVYGAFVAMMPR